MANISSAFGTIQFQSNNKDILNILYKSIDKMRGVYLTYLIDDFNNENVQKTDNSFTYSSSFDADGRWTYLNNISSYPYWIELTEKEIQQLEQNEWSIYYDFTDEEPGCSVLYQASVIAEHKANTEIKNLDIQYNVTNYDYTWVNLVKYGYYDSLYDYIDCNYFVEDSESAQYFIDAFEENMDDIAEYLRCDKGDINYILRLSGLEEIYIRAKKLLKA